VPGSDWGCALQITGLRTEWRRPRYVFGIDALQSLHLAIQCAGAVLESCEVRLEFLGQTEELFMPRFMLDLPKPHRDRIDAFAQRELARFVAAAERRQRRKRASGVRRVLSFVLVACALGGATAAQDGSGNVGTVTIPASQVKPNAADPFEPIAFLIGRWEGTSEGQPGTGKVQREYTRVLNSRFIHGRNRSEYPPQGKNPKGEIHEHQDWFSFDRARKRLVLRQFHVEGFVNQYVQDADSTAPLAFTTESIENVPAGWRARETYVVHGPDEFEEIFELAQAGKPFEMYSRARLKRVK
jgi:hypothetical protein